MQPSTTCLDAPLTQSVEYWSYEPKVAGSSPAWSIVLFFVHCRTRSRTEPEPEPEPNPNMNPVAMVEKKKISTPGFEPGSCG